jgi:hypothetical protein
MTTRHVSLAAILVAAVGVAVVVAQRSSQTPAGVTATGCVRQGGAPDVFILRGAAEAVALPESDAVQDPLIRLDLTDRSAVASTDYLLVSVPPRVDLSAHVNHKMEISGQKSDAAPPAGANAAERALPRLAVSDGREVAPNCSSGPSPSAR